MPDYEIAIGSTEDEFCVAIRPELRPLWWDDAAQALREKSKSMDLTIESRQDGSTEFNYHKKALTATRAAECMRDMLLRADPKNSVRILGGVVKLDGDSSASVFEKREAKGAA